MEVGIKPIWPEVASHYFFSFFGVPHQPGQHDLQRRRLVQVFIDFALCLYECFIERLSHPRMFFVNVAADDDEMHDRKDLRLLEVSAFGRRIVFEEPSHFSSSALECRWSSRSV